MNARELFNISKALLSKVEWERQYFHVGQIPDKDIKTLITVIANHLNTKKIHLILDRQKSRTLSINELEVYFKDNDEECIVWDEHFKFCLE
ncbi:hypothetical protein [Flammeovirga aprica]|uniref:Uncharacterized protein n=1 Tax=Flammeovirga aprica JL-4 TaxID=694437 RepID=A0A7X9P3C3_9BACT|nr:hypothetical protein [Flammeovirga aprica]NME68585.1 hypothetical protein [Flammeovirga aprica JL-4]